MSATLAGLKWKAEVNGRNSLNGKLYGVTITGHVEQVNPQATLYQIAQDIIGCVQEQNPEMEFAEELRLTVCR